MENKTNTPNIVIASNQEMIDHYNGIRLSRHDVGWKKIDYGFLQGQLILFSGYANMGKGTLVRQIAMQQNYRYNTKWGLYSPEDYPVTYLYSDMIHTWTGITTDTKYNKHLSPNQYLNAYETIKDIFKVVDFNGEMPSMNTLLSEFEKLISDYGCKGFIIDPFNNLSDMNTGERDDKTVRTVCLTARGWAFKHNVILIIVLHPKGVIGIRSGDDMRLPSYNELHYGSEWSKYADDIIFFHHPTFNSDKQNITRIMSLAKVKKQKISGKREDFILNWDYKTNRILDTNGECGLPCYEDSLFQTVDTIFHTPPIISSGVKIEQDFSIKITPF